MILPKRFLARCVVCVTLALFSSQSSSADENSFSAKQLEFFEKHVRPLLAEHCYSCHSTKAEKVQAGLLVDSRSSLLLGGDSGESLVPGNPEASLLIEAVRYESYEMPPKGKLPDVDIETLAHWVAMGAPWPDEPEPTRTSAGDEFDLQQRKSEHWLWQPVRRSRSPKVQNQAWPQQALDYFILHRLEENQLSPAPGTDRTALVRRIYFDLIGLPPTAEQVAKYVNDQRVDATERLIDDLLDSPHFGERWGRHWLDMVRYAESRGHEFDNDAPNAFQYRDYVIRAFNEDVPYDQFVREHIAGDLLENPRLHPERGFNESILGTGFWFLGEWVHSPVDIRKDESDRFDNMIDVMSKTFLGVTVSCARCHDHKFDAISTADYYSLTGFLESSDYRQVRFESLESNRSIAEQLCEIDENYQRKIATELTLLGIDPPDEPEIDEDISAPVLLNCGTLSDGEYLQDGFVWGERPTEAGSILLTETAGDWSVRLAPRTVASSDPFWQGLVMVSEKGQRNRSELASLPRSGRTLRTPTFELAEGKVTCRVRGAGYVVACVDSHRLLAGPLHKETLVKIAPDQEWITLNLDRYVGHRLHLEFTPAIDSELEVSFVTQGASQQILQKLEDFERVTAAAIEEKNLLLTDVLSKNSPEVRGLHTLVEEWASQRAELKEKVLLRSQLAMAMMDGTGEDGHILIRGNSSKPGSLEPRHFLTAVSGNQPMAIKRGSGRLELAGQINDPSNPLTSRVVVNRIWHHLMGRGIVPTTDDFGVLGQRPTHPELLDHLAVRFFEDGQSIKRMIRYLMLSRTYQMSSRAESSAIERDPKNLLWHHVPPKRLEGEAIRDALLAISGQLDETQFGEPVPVHLTPFMDGRGRPQQSGPLNGNGRRSIYLAVRRNFLSPFMLTFDTPVPFSTMGRRNVSNVPAQALILMNDPFVVEQAQHWAHRTLAQHESLESRVKWMYATAFARQPTDPELASATEFLKLESAARGVDENQVELWSDLAHALINLKEFIFLR